MTPRATAMGHRISWTGRTWNPGIFGCTLAGPECLSCYAATMAHRGLGPYADYKGEITKVDAHGVTWTGKVITDLDRVAVTAAQLPRRTPTLVFTTSMADLYHDDVHEDFLVAVHAEIAARPWLTFQELTKRAERRLHLYTDRTYVLLVERELQRRHPGATWPGWPLPNVWQGATAGDNLEPRHARLRALCATPTRGIRFVSVEPMIDPPDLRGYVERHPLTRATQGLRAGRYPMRGDDDYGSPINLVILGGESKYTRRAPRPFDLDGARAIVDYVGRCGPEVDVQIQQLGNVWAAAAGSADKAGADPADWPADLQPYYGLPHRLAVQAGLVSP